MENNETYRLRIIHKGQGCNDMGMFPSLEAAENHFNDKPRRYPQTTSVSVIRYNENTKGYQVVKNLQ